MITMDTDRLVDDYLRRLEAAAAHLQRSRRVDLVTEIQEHIQVALEQEETASETAVRNVLERLGPPEDIVDAAQPPPDDPRARTGKLEIAALIALVVPIVGWLFGVVLVLLSQAWTNRDKVVGVLLGLLPAFLPIALILGGADSSLDTGPVVPGDQGGGGPASSVPHVDEGVSAGEIAIYALAFLAGLPSALYLGWRLRRHPSTQPQPS